MTFKTISKDTSIKMYFSIEDKSWLIEDINSGDCESFDSKERCKEVFSSINSFEDLIKTFGWTEG